MTGYNLRRTGAVRSEDSLEDSELPCRRHRGLPAACCRFPSSILLLRGNLGKGFATQNDSPPEGSAPCQCFRLEAGRIARSGSRLPTVTGLRLFQTSFRARSLFLFLSLFLALTLPAPGQFENFLPGKKTPAASEKAAPDISAQLETWLTEAKASLAKLDALVPETGLPEGIKTTELASRRRVLNETILSIARHQAALESLIAAKAEVETEKALAEGWKGFDTSPPYSILMVDELRNLKAALLDKFTSQKSSIDIFNSSLQSVFDETKKAEEKINEALTASENGLSKNPTAVWKLEYAREKKRNLVVRASTLKANIAVLENLSRSTEIQLGLLDRKLKIAGRKAFFKVEDLEKIRTASADRQKEMRKEVSALRKRLGSAVEARKSALSTLEKLRSAPTPDPAALELAELQLETTDIRVNTMQMMIDSLDSYEQLEVYVPEAYEHRLTFMNSKSASERRAALDSLDGLHTRLNAWEVVAKNELDAVSAEINRRETRVSLLPADDPKLAPLNDQRNALREKRDLIQRVYISVVSQRDIITRWLEEFRKLEKAPWYQPVPDLFKRGWQETKRIWNIPVSSYTEVTREGGIDVTYDRDVTLGSVIRAIALFIFVYFIDSMISRHIQRLLIHRHYLGENQARTMRNWIMLVVAFFLALATLSYFSIPLTVFAFLAGALAIGVGFGTQTIIKNFISGIILLFERKVRVGDIVEVDGITGVVSEINTRSSIVRGFNGIENLIPNSLLLENRVVNWTLNSRFLRKELALGVAYGSPPQKVIDILLDAAERHGLILEDPAPFAVFNNFGDNSLDFVMYYWIELNDKTNSLVVGSDLRIMIEKKLADVGIDVPFPQRDIRLASDNPLQIEVVGKTEE